MTNLQSLTSRNAFLIFVLFALPFSAIAFSVETPTEKTDRLSRVLTHLKLHYFRPLTQEELTTGSLQELFAKLDQETVLKSTDPSLLDFVRGLTGERSVPRSKVLGKGLGYVKIAFFGRRTAYDFDQALEDLQKQGIEKLIIDLRSNTGGSLDSGLDVIDRFVPQGKLIATFRGRGNSETQLFSKKGRKISLPTFVLTDHQTASTAEIMADALRRYGPAQLVGGPTQGKRSVQEAFPIDRSHTLFLTTGYFSLPTDSDKGEVKPDFFVESDKALEKAVELAGGK